MSAITWVDKVGLIAKGVRINQWWDDDANEIKVAVNDNDTRISAIEGDYIAIADFVTVSAGAGDVGKGVILDAAGLLDDSVIPASVIDIGEDIDMNDFGILGLRDMTFTLGETLSWNTDFYTVDIPTGLGSTMQAGQETYFLIYNDTGVQINDGQVLHPVGGFLVGAEVIPTVILARADSHVTCEGTLFIATSNIPNGSLGMATIFGRLSDQVTNGFSPGDDLYLSPTVAGEYTNVRPSFPNYIISLGGVLSSHATEGSIAMNVTRDVGDTILSAWDGGFRETFDFTVSSNGTTITGTLERQGGGDLTMMFSSGFDILDCTPAQTIALTAGTDGDPQLNKVYILESTKTLAVSTADWPTVEHIKIADLEVQSAAKVQTIGAYWNRNWNDHIATTGNNGHLLHLAEKARQGFADWASGTEGSCTVSAATNSDVYVAVTSGKVYQLHKQTFPAADTSTGDIVLVTNHPTTPYTDISNLNTLITDSQGVTLNNRAFSFVLQGVQSKTGEVSHLIIKLPDGSYPQNSPDAAVEDAQNYSNYTVDRDARGVTFLIARFTYILSGASLDWELYDTEDLTGHYPNVTAGGGAGVTTFPGLLDVPDSYVGQAGVLPFVNQAETAIEFDTNLTWDGSSLNITGELDITGSIGGTPQTATGDGTTTIDWGAGNMFNFQFGAFNETFTFTAPTKPGTFILKLVQDSVGSRTATWPATVKWPGGTAPTLTTILTTGTDIITLYWDGTNYFAVDALNFS